jgi:PEP-CTERM motif
MSKRLEPTAAVPVIDWNAFLFLVSSPDTAGNIGNPVPITFYDGVEWGWTTTITPLPPTWPMMLVGLGMVGFMLRRRAAPSLPCTS